MRRAYESGGEIEIIDEIYEVYYDDNGQVNGWTQDPVGPSFYVDVDEGTGIADDVKRFMRACDKPTLDYTTGKEIKL
jgi:hypothetical protein